MPIRPRHERGNRVLRYAIAALLLIAIVGGSAFAITTYLERDDGGDPETAQTVPSTTDSDSSGDQNLGAADATPEEDEQEAASEATPPPDDEDEATAESQQQLTDDEESAEPTSTAAADVEVAADGGDVAQQGEEGSGGETGAASQEGPIGAAGYLLDLSALPEGWAVFEEGERTREEVASQLGENGEELLTSWRWRENPYRNFIRANGENFPNENTFLSISAHRFASEQGATEALTYFADIVVNAQGLQDVQMEVIGDESRGLSGPSEGANLYVLYIRHGNYVVRLGGSSVTGDPSPQVNEVAQQIVANNS